MKLPSVRVLAAGLGTFIVVFVLVAGILAPWITPYDPFITNLEARMLPPAFMEGGTPANFLGTHQLGRDYFSRLIYGARISMLIGVATVVTSGLIGITLGLIGGFFGGRVDDVVMFAITCRLSIPLILVALAVVGLIGSSLTVVVLALGLLLWDRFAVVTRTTTMQVRNQDYVAAAWAAGCSRLHILTREVLPNIAHHLVVVATLEMALAILLEAALSFLGLGFPPDIPSWGRILFDAKDYLDIAPHWALFPGGAIFLAVLSISFFGDGLRDALDPRKVM